MRPFGLAVSPGSTGGPALWTPATLAADVEIWFDAADTATITHTGGLVSQWDDKSGSGRHAAQASGAYQPQYSATGFAGQPALLFDSDVLQATISTRDDVDFSIAAVLDTAVNTETSGVAVQTSRNLIYQGAGTDWRCFAGAVNNSIGPNGTLVFMLSVDYGGMSRFRADGASVATPSLAGTVQTGGNMLIGATSQPPSTALTGGVPVAEIVLFGRALSLAECETVEGYLAHKWNIAAALPGGHPHKSAAPTE